VDIECDDVCTNYTQDEQRIADQLITEHYDMLTRIARAKRRRMNVNDTFATTEILHETYFKMSDKASWTSSEHFIRCAALAMRCVIVDHARKKLTAKRGSGAKHVSIDDHGATLPEYSETPEEIIGISDLLQKLAKLNPRWMRIVDARYFSGMTEGETAEALGLSARTVRRDWRDARDWMAGKMAIS